MPGRHSKKPFDTLSHYHVSLAGKIGQRGGGGGGWAWVVYAGLLHITSSFSSRGIHLFLNLTQKTFLTLLKQRDVTLEPTAGMGAGRRAGWHAATNEHQVEIR